MSSIVVVSAAESEVQGLGGTGSRSAALPFRGMNRFFKSGYSVHGRVRGINVAVGGGISRYQRCSRRRDE